MDTMVHAVNDFRGTFTISDYRWFNLRDGNSMSPNFQTQYGLMTDEYRAKPAFGLYRRLVARFTIGRSSARPPRGDWGSPSGEESERAAEQLGD